METRSPATRSIAALVAACSIFVSAAPALAGGGDGPAGFEQIGTYAGKDLAFFYTTSHTASPACNSYRKRWVIDLSTPMGKSMYAFLLSMVAAGREVHIAGTNDCGVWGDSETVAAIGQPMTTVNSTDIPTF